MSQKPDLLDYNLDMHQIDMMTRSNSRISRLSKVGVIIFFISLYFIIALNCFSWGETTVKFVMVVSLGAIPSLIIISSIDLLIRWLNFKLRTKSYRYSKYKADCNEYERKITSQKYDAFKKESIALCPAYDKKSKFHILRYTWRRAYVLSHISKEENDDASQELFSMFCKLAEDEYFKATKRRTRISITDLQFKSIYEQEKKAFLPPPLPSVERIHPNNFDCIYLGIDEGGKTYVGQTKNEPEFRWIQHRKSSTGPFKDGAKYVEWRVLERAVATKYLDALESFYIGLYNAYDNGYNGNRGNDIASYQQGCSRRQGQQLG